MKVLITVLVLVIAVSGIAFNLTTKSGKIYKDYEILTVTDEKITIAHESGSAAVAISDLPDNVKSRILFRIDAYKAKNVTNVNTVQETSNTTVAPAAAPVVKVAEAPAASQPVAPAAAPVVKVVEAPAASQPVVPADAPVVKVAEPPVSQPEVPSQYSYRATEISEKQFNKLWNMFKGALYLDTTTGILQEINCPGSSPKVSNYIRIMSLPEFKQYLNNGGVLYFWVKQPVQGNDEHVKIKRSVRGHGNDEYIKQEIEIAKIMDYNVNLGIQQDNNPAKYSYRKTEISEQQFNKLWDMFKGAIFFDKTTGRLLEIRSPVSNLNISNRINSMSQPELKKYLDNGGVLYFWIKVPGRDEYFKQEIEIAQIMNYNVALGIQQEYKNEHIKYLYRGTEISEKQFNKLWDMFKGILYKQRNSGHRDNEVSFAEITRPGQIPDYNTTELMTKEEFKIYLDQGGVLYRWFKKPEMLANPGSNSNSDSDNRHGPRKDYVKKEIEISQIMNYPTTQL